MKIVSVRQGSRKTRWAAYAGRWVVEVGLVSLLLPIAGARAETESATLTPSFTFPLQTNTYPLWALFLLLAFGLAIAALLVFLVRTFLPARRPSTSAQEAGKLETRDLQEGVETRYCSFCGEVNSRRDRFCTSCGRQMPPAP